MSGGVSPEMFTHLVAFGMFVVLYILFHLLDIIARTCVWCKGYKFINGLVLIAMSTRSFVSNDSKYLFVTLISECPKSLAIV